MFEHATVSSISEHVNSTKIICTDQHGFCKQHSCETQLLGTINDLFASLNAGNQINLLLLHFSKAFDKVSHPHLLHKLSSYGIRGPLYWIGLVTYVNDLPCKITSKTRLYADDVNLHWENLDENDIFLDYRMNLI